MSTPEKFFLGTRRTRRTNQCWAIVPMALAIKALHKARIKVNASVQQCKRTADKNCDEQYYKLFGNLPGHYSGAA